MSSKLVAEVEPKIEMGWAGPNARVMPSGIAVAALMSSMLGMLALAVVNVFTTASKDFNAWVHGVGKLWMPGAAGIGPYSGKETTLWRSGSGRGWCCTTRCASASSSCPLGWWCFWWGWGRDDADLAAGVRVSRRPKALPGESARCPSWRAVAEREGNGRRSGTSVA